MAIKFKTGAQVKQILPAPITGVVQEATIAGDEVVYKVGWTSPDGHEESRFFNEDQIEAVGAQE
jgi:hypothetical protein